MSLESRLNSLYQRAANENSLTSTSAIRGVIDGAGLVGGGRQVGGARRRTILVDGKEYKRKRVPGTAKQKAAATQNPWIQHYSQVAREAKSQGLKLSAPALAKLAKTSYTPLEPSQRKPKQKPPKGTKRTKAVIEWPAKRKGYKDNKAFYKSIVVS